VTGTFGYMAPEQLHGRASPASDLYAVAAMTLTLLTGSEPEELPHRGLSIDVAKALGREADARLVEILQ
jgi:serine/threonine protein kinase